MSIEFEVDFDNSTFPPVKVPAGENLSEHLHACNSTILFGCRSGLCGTCLIEVVHGQIAPPNQEELEALKIYAPDNPQARLACQLEVCGPIKLKKI
ncbi:MAG: 2Fe-2S iron-sulfur cluster-binding protein [Chlamydiales bacterium]